ncbi:MAG: NADH-quinone oxidoreductase subunit C [Myxococcota bacterium]
MNDFGSPVLRRLLDGLPGAALETHADHGDATAVVERARVAEVLRFLRDDEELAFEMLSDICAVDYLPKSPRFEVVYHLYSVAKNHRLRVKVSVPEDDASVPTATGLYPSADWMEREVWDLYGIRFEGHADLRRILLYDEFEGHPLRKDYAKEKRQPLVGPRN